MKKYTVNVSQSGGEYYGTINIKCNNLEQIDHNTIKVDNVEITFEYEYIQEIKKEIPEQKNCPICGNNLDDHDRYKLAACCLEKLTYENGLNKGGKYK